MNEFQREVLVAVTANDGITSAGLMDYLMLDDADKPKLSRNLSLMKKDGHLTSKMGEDGLLEWSAVEQSTVTLDAVCPKPAMRFDIKAAEPVPEPEPVKTDYVPVYPVIGFKHSLSHEVFDTIDDCLESAQQEALLNQTSAKVYQVMANQVAQVEFVPASAHVKFDMHVEVD